MTSNGNNGAGVKKIQTFVFLDIETTGLPTLSFGKCAITELAMWVTRREDLQQSSEASTRRLLNKWTMVFNPAMPISNDSTRITGLDNFMLENYNTFDSNACDAIITYLQHFPKPICFVAHNGNAFDYPIIKMSFKKRGKSMPDFILCCDSLSIFKEIDNIEQQLLEVSKRGEKIANGNFLVADDDCVIDQDDTDVFLSELFDSGVEKFQERQRINETTPRRNRQEAVKRSIHRRDQFFDDQVPVASTSASKKARKELFPPPNPVREIANNIIAGFFKKDRTKHTTTPVEVIKRQSSAPSSPRKSFRLPDIYERVFKQKPIVSHTAEADVHALYALVRHFGNDFLELADEMAVSFSSVSDTPKA